MFQLRNLVNGRNVKKDPSDDVNANEDFFSAVLHGHIISAAMEVFKMDSPNGKSCVDFLPQDVSALDTEKKMIYWQQLYARSWTNLSTCPLYMTMMRNAEK